jgi:chloramphenicol 3-O-phosphotransferase
MKQAVAILLNGASSSGKSTLCRALHDQLTELADGDPASAYGLVAFDDMALLLSDRLFPRTLVHLQGGDTSRLVSHKPHDGRAAWEYVDDSHTDGRHGGAPRLSLRFNPLGRRILAGLHRSWGQHLELGTNLIIDHFLQEQDWQDEVLPLLRASGARLLLVGVHCSLAELEHRESGRGDGRLEERPRGLARRSDELCHSHGLIYDVTVDTSLKSTAESVQVILEQLQASSH